MTRIAIANSPIYFALHGSQQALHAVRPQPEAEPTCLSFLQIHSKSGKTRSRGLCMDMSKIIIGAMRFKNRESAAEVIHRAIDAGFNYIDTSPCYCYQSETENSESWIGEAMTRPGYRERVMLSTKCAPGNGGMGMGEFDPKGFGVRSVDQLRTVFETSLRRLGVSKVDYYHLWTTHTMEQFSEAQKPGGWLDGVRSMKSCWDHLGITTHADNKTIVSFLESGLFETVTLPLNIVNRTRLKAVEWAVSRGIRVIAMNPLAGGFLATNPQLKELAFRYLMAMEGVHLLVGFSSVEEVDYAKWIMDTTPGRHDTPEKILEQVDALVDTTDPRCTSCGYCAPCPENINVGASLSYFNLYKYLGMQEAKTAFREKQWEEGLRLDRCQSCGVCETRCPNGLKVTEIIQEAKGAMYG